MLYHFCLYRCLGTLRHMKRYVKRFNVPVQVLLRLIHKPGESHTREGDVNYLTKQNQNM